MPNYRRAHVPGGRPPSGPTSKGNPINVPIPLRIPKGRQAGACPTLTDRAPRSCRRSRNPSRTLDALELSANTGRTPARRPNRKTAGNPAVNQTDNFLHAPRKVTMIEDFNSFYVLRASGWGQAAASGMEADGIGSLPPDEPARKPLGAVCRFSFFSIQRNSRQTDPSPPGEDHHAGGAPLRLMDGNRSQRHAADESSESSYSLDSLGSETRTGVLPTSRKRFSGHLRETQQSLVANLVVFPIHLIRKDS